MPAKFPTLEAPDPIAEVSHASLCESRYRSVAARGRYDLRSQAMDALAEGAHNWEYNVDNPESLVPALLAAIEQANAADAAERCRVSSPSEYEAALAWEAELSLRIQAFSS